MVFEISFAEYFMPLFMFLFVFIIIFLILEKIKIVGENKFAHLLISFIISIIFSTTTKPKEYIQTITPWVVVFVICIFFILLVIGMSQQKAEIVFKPSIVWFIVIVLIIIFLISANMVFSNFMFLDKLKSTISENTKIFDFIILVIVVVVVSWILTKK
ncbi:MAG: hypothetical protein QW117_01105 [Candidatus Pacearchaeota archaeon]